MANTNVSLYFIFALSPLSSLDVYIYIRRMFLFLFNFIGWHFFVPTCFLLFSSISKYKTYTFSASSLKSHRPFLVLSSFFSHMLTMFGVQKKRRANAGFEASLCWMEMFIVSRIDGTIRISLAAASHHKSGNKLLLLFCQTLCEMLYCTKLHTYIYEPIFGFNRLAKHSYSLSKYVLISCCSFFLHYFVGWFVGRVCLHHFDSIANT